MLLLLRFLRFFKVFFKIQQVVTFYVFAVFRTYSRTFLGGAAPPGVPVILTLMISYWLPTEKHMRKFHCGLSHSHLLHSEVHWLDISQHYPLLCKLAVATCRWGLQNRAPLCLCSHMTFSAVSVCGQSIVVSWWSYCGLVVGYSPTRVQWSGIRWRILFGTKRGVSTTSDRRWRLAFSQCNGTFSALEALRDALYE